MVINNNNFYKEFDLLYNKLNIDNDILYTEFLELYEKYAFNNKANDNLIYDLKTNNIYIDEEGLLNNIWE